LLRDVFLCKLVPDATRSVKALKWTLSTLKLSVLTASLLVLAVTAVYAPSLEGDWLGDDHFLVVDAECARGLYDWPDIVLQRAGQCNYRPTRYLSYALDYEIWGLNPLGYRVTNVLLHIFATLLLLATLRALKISWLPAIAGASLFAIHPVQADSVAYVAGRRDVLTGLGYLLGLLAAIHFDRRRQDSTDPTGPSPSWMWGLLAGFGALVSVTSKEMGVSLLVVLIVFFCMGGHRGLSGERDARMDVRDRLRKIWPLLAAVGVIAGAMFVHRGLLRPASTMVGELFGGTLGTHIATVLAAHARYAEMLLVPVQLAGDYSPPAIPVAESFFEAPTLIGLAWLTSLLGGAYLCARRGWLPASFGLIWYVVALLPVSHIIPHHEIAAEHYLYIPLAGLAVTAAGLLDRLTQTAAHSRRRRVAVAVVVCLILGALATRTTIRSFDYRSEVAHARATLEVVPDSVRGNARLGVALLKQGEFEEAKPHLQYVLGTGFQGSARLDVLEALGDHYVRNANYEAAVKPLVEYVRHRPSEVEAMELLAHAHLELGNLEKSLELTHRLIELSPTSARYYYLRGLALARGGRTEQAMQAVTDALLYDEKHLESLLLGADLYSETRPGRALELLRDAKQRARQRPLEDWEEQQLEVLERKLMPKGDDR
jgi:protein O-mannosyl-transferase